MRIKDTIRGLPDRRPDDCKLIDVIDEITKLDGLWLRASDLPPLTQARRDAIDESMDHLERPPECAVPWRDALDSMRR
jgi:hypothetical protein